MSSAPSQSPNSGPAGRLAGDRRTRRGVASRRRQRQRALEHLEPRTLLAVLPPVTVEAQRNLSGTTDGNESSPSVAVNPSNAQQVVAVWTRFDPNNLGGPGARPTQAVTQGAFSTNGGVTWTSFTAQGTLLSDPATSNPVLPFNFATDASVAFDRDNNFYIVQAQHNNDNTSGAIVLRKYSFAGGAPAVTIGGKVIYEWTGNQNPNQARNPVVAVDAGVRNFMDPDTGQVQANPFSGNVYVAWSTVDANPNNLPNWNPNAIRLVGSSDGGQSFSVPRTINDGGNFGDQRNAVPRLVVSQGGSGVQAGQVTVVWDDFGTLATAVPIPLDRIRSDRVTPVLNAQFAGPGGIVADGVAQADTNQPHIARTTTFSTVVNLDPRFVTIDDLNVGISLVHPAIGEIRIRLIPPAGSGLAPITLLDNRTTAANTAKPGGATGANLGPPSPLGSILGTIFDAQAGPSIVGNGGGNASTGFFRPDNPAPAPPVPPPVGPTPATGQALPGEAPPFGNSSPSPFSLLADIAGLSAASLNGTWTLEITDFRFSGNNPPPTQGLVNWSLMFSSGLADNVDRTVATTTVRGNLTGGGLIASAATPLGIGPAPTIAADNTLGSFSPNQGRLYVAYVDRFDQLRDGAPAQGNPADNTDIRLAVSDDGGASWQIVSTKVNDDDARRDGFSGAAVSFGTDPIVTGRPQFQPQVAVDQATGMLVLSFLDARHDAARARVATYVATSIDGGDSFGPQTFVNAPQVAFDQITRQDVTLGPIPGNQSPGNPLTEANFAFGTRQGLAVHGGRIYPAYSSNLNGGDRGTTRLETIISPSVTAGGPRVIASTMGPVKATTVNGLTFNADLAGDGTPEVQGFAVTFDRPVDIRSFTQADVQVVYRSPTAASGSPGVPIAVFSPVPLDQSGPFGLLATTFFIPFIQPQSSTGTYSYTIGPLVNDLIRSTGTVVTPVRTVTVNSANVPRTIPDLATITSTLNVGGIPAGEVVGDVDVNLTLRHTFDSDLQITLISPGGIRIVLSQNRGGAGADFLGTTFDDQAATPIAVGTAPFTGRFAPDQSLGLLIGSNPNGTWTLEVADQVGLDEGVLQAWSITIQTGTVSTTGAPGNAMDQDADSRRSESVDDVYSTPKSTGGTLLRPPYDPATLPLIVPGPHVVGSAVPGVVADTVDNLVLNGTAAAIDVTFDRDIQVASFTAADVVRMMGPAGQIVGPFAVSPVNPSGGVSRTFRIGFPTQTLGGTYTVVLGPDILSSRGDRVDANLNAGLDALRGTVDPATGSTAIVTFNAVGGPVTLEPGKTTTTTIAVGADFVLQDVDLRLNITHPDTRDLEAVLVVPDAAVPGGVRRIRLFTGVGSNVAPQANFNDTTLDDEAATPIQNGGPPFFGRFKPQEPLDVLVGGSSARTYTLEITNTGARAGTLNAWSLLLTEPRPGTGLGEPISDRTTVGFRLFTMDPTDARSTDTWTAVGPASIMDASGNPQATAGRIGGLAIDPSDPSGNTVYVAGASGGVWKTTDFLTNSPLGPTYHPVTDFGPTLGLNIGSLAVFGRNGDPNQSIVFAATGEGNTGSPGVGLLRSMDGGRTWTVLDSTRNVDAAGNVLPIDSPARDHIFVGSTSFKVVVDPRPTVNGETIVYLALSGNNGGLWRSRDTGKTWQLLRAGQATDVVLDPASGPIDAVSNPTGNLQIVYAAFRGEGVFLSSNQGTVLSLMAGGVGKPLVRNADTNPASPIPVVAPISVPNGAKGRIVLAKPDLIPSTEPNAALRNQLHQGWLYAAVADAGSGRQGGGLEGLYVTKDFGQNWTRIRLPNLPGSLQGRILAVPSNDNSLAAGQDYDIGGGPPFGQANYDLVLLVDPNDPEVVYLGGSRNGQQSGLIRVDISGLSDPHAFYLGNDNPDGGLRRAYTNDPVTLTTPDPPPSIPIGAFSATSFPTLNLLQDPFNPFVNNATVRVSNASRIANTGADARWVPYDVAIPGMNDVQRAVAMRDPLTGRSRLIFGTDHGVSTALDAGRDGLVLRGIGDVADGTQSGGDVALINGSRNGNLQITQFYYGATQPSSLAADIATIRGFFYGEAQDDGHPSSNPDILDSGNIRWNPPGRGDGSGVATDQTGTGTVYQYMWPCCGGSQTDFFRVNGVGRTFGLIQQNLPGDVPDPQWPFLSPLYEGGHAMGNFAVNPINGDQIIISSNAGRVFGTTTQGRFWLPIGEPSALDGTYAQALAYGAPLPGDPTGATNNFLYAGTVGGRVFVTFTGGGGSGNNWINITNGDLTGNTAAVQQIITNPTRGSREAYAVTTNGVYHLRDADPASGQTWRRINGDLFTLRHNPFSIDALGGGELGSQTQLRYLNAIQADWRYVIPDDLANPGGPTHPVLYVAGEGGVYRSLDNGATWSLFPDVALNGAPREGGYLPNAHVTDLDLSLGNINPTTGRPDVATGENILAATTYGRGVFAIRLAPLVLPNRDGQPRILGIDRSTDSGLSDTDQITNVRDPIVVGLGEQTAFGNRVRITLYEVDPADPSDQSLWRYIGGYDGTPATDVAANWTNSAGRFSVRVNPGALTTDGVKMIGVQATNLSGTKGNLATFNFTLDTVAPTPAQLADLQAASDTGLSNSDEITNPNLIGQPATGTLRFDVGFAADPTGANTQAALYRNNAPIGTPVLGLSSAILVEPGGFPSDGVYAYKVRLQDLAGNLSDLSLTPALNVRVDTKVPGQPSAPKLAAGSNSGSTDDNVTNVQQPLFTGDAEPNTFPRPNQTGTTPRNIVRLLDSANNVVGTGEVQSDGKYAVQPSAPLGAGTYTFTVEVIDVAGNTSVKSGATTIEIRIGTPTKPTVRLVPTDDSGSPGDNVTNVQRPRFQGTGQPGLRVVLLVYDVTGQVTGQPANSLIALEPTGSPILVDITGNYRIQLPRIQKYQGGQPVANTYIEPPDGLYRVVVRTVDVAGNFSDSDPLNPNLQILTKGSGATATIKLLDADNTGNKNDSVTTTRKPRIEGNLGTAGANALVALLPAGVPLNQANELATRVRADRDGKFVVQPQAFLYNGVLSVVAVVVDNAGNYGALSNVLSIKIASVPGDFSADGKADPVSFNRAYGLFGVGFTGPNAPASYVDTFGGKTGGKLIPIQADFDGDGKADPGYVDYATSTWYVHYSSTGLVQVKQFGAPGLDLPVPEDYDGDGYADYAVYRPTTAQWLSQLSGGGALVKQFGWGGVDRAVPGDVDGDGKAELLLYRPTTAEWITLRTSDNAAMVVQFGWAGVDIPAPADYNGDGKMDLAVYWPANSPGGQNGQGRYLIRGGGQVVLGSAGDIAVPQDYDNDGKADPAVYRPSESRWIINRTGTTPSVANFVVGAPNSIPTGAPLFPYRMPVASPTTGGSDGGGTVTTAAAGGGGSVSARAVFAGTGGGSTFHVASVGLGDTGPSAPGQGMPGMPTASAPARAGFATAGMGRLATALARRRKMLGGPAAVRRPVAQSASLNLPVGSLALGLAGRRGLLRG